MTDQRRAPAPERNSLRVATAWSYSLTWGKQAITAVLSFVLAAMLGPSAFGLIAMALVFTSLILMLQQQGLMPAIISRKELSDLHKDTAFWLVVGAGAGLTVIGMAVAPLWAEINHLPELTRIVQVLALTIPLTSSVVVHEAILRRNLEFKRLAIRSWLSVLAGGFAGILGVMLGWGVWALVAQQMVMATTEVVVLWRVTQWRPRLRWSSTAARELWGYSSRSASSSLGLFIGGRMDIILGGAFFGPAVIGLYRMGQRVTQMVLELSARGTQSVSLPGLSEVQSDHDAFRKRLLAMLRQTGCLSLPLFGLVAGLAPCIERFLGSAWTGVAPAIALLAVVRAIVVGSMLLGPALQAAGRPGTLSLLMWLYAFLNVCAIVVASRLPGGADDLISLCVAMLIATITGSIVMVVVVSRCLRIPVLALVKPWIPGSVAGVVSAIATYAVYVSIASLPWVLAGGVASVAGLTLSCLVVIALDESMRTRVRVLAPGWIAKPPPE